MALPKAKRGPAMRKAKERAAKVPGGKGKVRNRPAGRKIMGPPKKKSRKK